MKFTFFKPTVFLLIGILGVLCTISFVDGKVAKPEKIFRHDRGEPEKLARIDLDNEELQRALEDLRRRVPEYTGYLVVDVIFEFFKLLFIFLLRLLGQQQQLRQDTTSA